MNEYKKNFRSKIYDLNYDLLVSNPKEEIESLISYLGWSWDEIYLKPHLNKRTVTTQSVVQVRSPINSKSIGGSVKKLNFKVCILLWISDHCVSIFKISVFTVIKYKAKSLIEFF